MVNLHCSFSYCLSLMTVYKLSITKLRYVQYFSISARHSIRSHTLPCSKRFVKWIQSYLAYHVAVNGTQSSAPPVVSGVPQGSVLSPLLFLMYVNDVTCVISKGNINIVLYQIIRSPMDYNHTRAAKVDSISALTPCFFLLEFFLLKNPVQRGSQVVLW